MSKPFYKKKLEPVVQRKVILRVKNDTKDHGVISNNFPHWLRYWTEIKISDYGEKYVTALKNMERIPIMSSTELAVKFPIKPLKIINLDLFNTTEDQEAQLTAITGQGAARHRDRLVVEWKRAWVEELTAANAEIQAENDAVKKERESKQEFYLNYMTVSNQIISAALDSVDDNLRLEIKNWINAVDDIATTYEEAKSKGDFLWIFEAARAIVYKIQNVDDEQDLDIDMRETVVDAVKTCKHMHDSYDRWVQRFEDALNRCESLGYPLLEVDKCHWFLKNLNDDIFGDFKRQATSKFTKDKVPRNDYLQLKKFVVEEYTAIWNNNPELVLKIMRNKGKVATSDRESNELSLKANEVNPAVKEADVINYSKDYGNNKKKVMKNKRYHNNGNKAKSASDVKAVGNTEIDIGGHVNINGPNVKNPCHFCGSAEHWQSECMEYQEWYNKAKLDRAKSKLNKYEKVKKCTLIVPSDFISDVAAGDQGVFYGCEVQAKAAGMCAERTLIVGVLENQIDFILDTGTEKGVAGRMEADALANIRAENVQLIGVSGSAVSREVGTSMFGDTRILDKHCGSVLVSQDGVRKMYSVIEMPTSNPDPESWGNVFKLVGRANTQWEGLEWTFIRDTERYGDKLLHCTLPRAHAKRLAGGRLLEKTLSAKVKKFYDPPGPLDEDGLSAAAKESLVRAEMLHRRLGHAHSNELLRFVGACPGCSDVSSEDIETWRAIRQDSCTGCLEGKLQHPLKIRSTKPVTAEYPGQVGAADLMFVEGRKDAKTPVYMHVDIKTSQLFAVPISDKTVGSLELAFDKVLAKHKASDRQLKKVIFDRESAILNLEDHLANMGVTLQCKSAGQKVGNIEVRIRHVREKARSTKAGVRERYGYLPPNQFNVFLIRDTVQVLNRIPKPGQAACPHELFTGKKIDFVRDFRAEWGEFILVKRPKAIASDLRVAADWAVVLHRVMDGTGNLVVYNVRTKKVCVRLKFVRAKVPDWVIAEVRNISIDAKIGLEGDEDNPEGLGIGEIDGAVQRVDPIGAIAFADPATVAAVAPSVAGFEEVSDEVDDAIAELEEYDTAYEFSALEEGGYLAESGEEVLPRGGPTTRSRVDDPQRLELEREADRYAEYVAMGWRPPDPEDEGTVRFGNQHRRNEGNLARARETLRRAYLERYGDTMDNRHGVDTAVEEIAGLTNFEEVNVLYHEAIRVRPEAAEAALLKEVLKCCEKDIWAGVHERELTRAQQDLILPMMKNYIDKFHPDGSYDKAKVRVLVRGDLQVEVGETEGPVARIESLLILICIAVALDLEVFKVDITSAYMNTDMPSDVSHRWVLLDRDVVKLLLKINPSYWRPYLRKDGKILVQMKKLMYGFREAAKYWNKTLTEVFIAAGYTACFKDSCVLWKRQGDLISICGITVDDCLFVTSRGVTWRDEQVVMLKSAFGGLTVEFGDVLQIVGMHVTFDRVGKKAKISQGHYASKLREFGINKGAASPALGDFFVESEEDALLGDQRSFMSLNSYLMFGAKRTYPEILPEVVTLSTKYNRATTGDYAKAVRVAQYVFGTKDEHCLVLRPESLQIVATSDAADGVHSNGRGHTGGTVGFESASGCWFSFISKAQPFVAQSSGEAELVAVNTVGNMADWSRQLMEELGFPQEPLLMYQDSECSLKMLKRGTGSFKRAKHIKIRWFWLKELIDAGVVVMRYIATDELVADILTKPLVGYKFRYLRAKLLGRT